jgi:predicted DNA-binding transcriptional regulator YafY
MDILRHGAHVFVVGPEELQQEVKTKLAEALSRYS